ncbi:MAG: hypothetical protein KAT68_08100 [Bacteroidales bacterium]|nr:hypothetical protein [Bacteroidales bacterium]
MKTIFSLLVLFIFAINLFAQEQEKDIDVQKKIDTLNYEIKTLKELNSKLSYRIYKLKKDFIETTKVQKYKIDTININQQNTSAEIKIISDSLTSTKLSIQNLEKNTTNSFDNIEQLIDKHFLYSIIAIIVVLIIIIVLFFITKRKANSDIIHATEEINFNIKSIDNEFFRELKEHRKSMNRTINENKNTFETQISDISRKFDNEFSDNKEKLIKRINELKEKIDKEVNDVKRILDNEINDIKGTLKKRN